MATNIPPHNLSELVDATIYQIENPDACLMILLKYCQRTGLSNWWYNLWQRITAQPTLLVREELLPRCS